MTRGRAGRALAASHKAERYQERQSAETGRCPRHGHPALRDVYGSADGCRTVSPAPQRTAPASPPPRARQCGTETFTALVPLFRLVLAPAERAEILVDLSLRMSRRSPRRCQRPAGPEIRGAGQDRGRRKAPPSATHDRRRAGAHGPRRSRSVRPRIST